TRRCGAGIHGWCICLRDCSRLKVSWGSPGRSSTQGGVVLAWTERLMRKQTTSMKSTGVRSAAGTSRASWVMLQARLRRPVNSFALRRRYSTAVSLKTAQVQVQVSGARDGQEGCCLLTQVSVDGHGGGLQAR